MERRPARLGLARLGLAGFGSAWLGSTGLDWVGLGSIGLDWARLGLARPGVNMYDSVLGPAADGGGACFGRLGSIGRRVSLRGSPDYDFSIAGRNLSSQPPSLQAASPDAAAAPTSIPFMWIWPVGPANSQE